jgi:hypothetical protein
MVAKKSLCFTLDQAQALARGERRRLVRAKWIPWQTGQSAPTHDDRYSSICSFLRSYILVGSAAGTSTP